MVPVPPAAAETTVAGLRALRAGSPTGKVPLVLLHGGGPDNSAISWYRAMEPLSADRMVWAFDLPGFGGSIGIPPVGGPVELAKVVLGAMDGAGLDRAVVGGVSMGGDVALNVVLMAPARVAGLILIGTGGLVPASRTPGLSAGPGGPCSCRIGCWYRCPGWSTVLHVFLDAGPPPHIIAPRQCPAFPIRAGKYRRTVERALI